LRQIDWAPNVCRCVEFQRGIGLDGLVEIEIEIEIGIWIEVLALPQRAQAMSECEQQVSCEIARRRFG
jgi:hypothetical protein